MSGGQLVVLDRLGRDVKHFPLSEGVVTLGRDHSCDIRIMLDAVEPHHATIAVHSNQTVVRSVGGGRTLVNGRAVSVAALRHGDVLGIGGRELRWDYAAPGVRRAQAPQPALYVASRTTRARRATGPAPPPRDPALHAALELAHRASMPAMPSAPSAPASAGGKQVAIVQPQRRDTGELLETTPRSPSQSGKRGRPSRGEEETTTKASQWIESRRSGRAQSARKATPLRLAVLRKAQSARKINLTKIEAPLSIDHTKQAALLLMTGHTPKTKLLSQTTPSPKSTSSKPVGSSRKSTGTKATTSKLTSPKPAASKPATPKSASPKSESPKSASQNLTSPKSAGRKSGGRRSASFVIKKKSPRSTPRARTSRAATANTPRARSSRAAAADTPRARSSRAPAADTPQARSSRGAAADTPRDQTVTLLETSADSRGSLCLSRRSGNSFEKSPPLPKSALKNPLAKKSMRKTESIKFDLSNLESSQESDVLMMTGKTRRSEESAAEDLTLYYSESSSAPSPSPRRPLHSRSSKILAQTLGTSVTLSPPSPSSALTPESPRSRKSWRGSIIVQKALSESAAPLSPRRTRTLSPRSPQNDLESYSIVDLVSVDSNSSLSTSVYNSVASNAQTPRKNASRKTRSIIEPTLLSSSTPYATLTKSLSSRSQSTPGATTKTSNDSTRLTSDDLLWSDTSQMSRRSQLSNNRSNVSRNGPRLVITRSRLSNTRSRLSSNSSKLSDDKSRLSSVSSRLVNDRSRQSSVSSRLVNDRSRQSSVTSNLSNDKSRLSNVSSKSSNDGSRQSSVRSELSNDKSRLLNVSSKSSNDRSRLSSVSSKLSNDRSRQSVSSKLSNTATRLSNNDSEFFNDESRNDSILSHKMSQSRNKSSLPSRKTKSLSTPENASIPISVNSTRISRASRSRSRINDSDLLLVEPEESGASPRSSKRRTTTAPDRSSSASHRGATAVSRTPVGVLPQNEGTSTPENTHSPEEATTPVLSIQSLLDSSQNSILSQSAKRRGSALLKRKTIAVVTGPKTKISAKSKSMNFNARQTRLTLGQDAHEDPDISKRADDEVVTPKSAVKLVQEAVKNKHSTAKKPLSKRSMIDDLNESDIIKQLFNSPVKRKLSQSMTEFSRKQLFDDDDIVRARRRTRNTVGQGRSPDESLLDRTEAFTPEQFVSPINTPTHSPNLTGIKRLFGKKTPHNDLRNVRGVKALLRTPRARQSIRNDLTDVAGMKAVFGRSPRNRLSDVEIKAVFARSPRNDLTRISGVKSLFHSQKKTKSPRNSLGDVRGVKKLFNTRSSNNDLRNVSGVKPTLEQMSPTNDLRDVRGVKRLFRREGGRNELNDMSGVEELFNESNQSRRDAESVFDQLVGTTKPTVRAVYSKTFVSKPKATKKKNSPKTKSLLDITLNPEEWLEKNLKMLLDARSKLSQLNKDAESISKSANRSRMKVVRVLESLATAAAAGSPSPRASRSRAGTTRTSRAILAQKSVSELYSAQKLPIKKRSFADAAVENANGDSRLLNLPIKKRTVVHSTPVKGRPVNLTMNASELGRVSPIVADKTRHLDHDVPTSAGETQITEVRSRSRRAARTRTLTSLSENIKSSSKKTRAKSKVATSSTSQLAASRTKDKSLAKPKTPSPKKKIGRPLAKAASPKQGSVIVDNKTRHGRPKLIVKRSSIVVSPKARASRRRKENDSSPAPGVRVKVIVKRSSIVVSPKARASRRRKEDDSSPTPAGPAKVIVKKSSIVISPKARVSRRRKEMDPSPASGTASKETRITRNKREVVVNKLNSPKKSKEPIIRLEVVSKQPPQLKLRATRRTAKSNEVEKPKEVIRAVEPKATRKADVKSKNVESPEKSTQSRKLAKKVTVDIVPKARGKRNIIVASDKSKKSVAEVAKVSPKEPKTTARTAIVQEPVASRSTRRTKGMHQLLQEVPKVNTQVKTADVPKTTRTRKTAQESINSEPTTRSRRGSKPVTSAPESTRKRKSVAEDERPAKVSKKAQSVERRGRSQKVESSKNETQNVSEKSVPKVAKKSKKPATAVVLKKPRSAEVSAVVPKESRPTRGKKKAVAAVALESGKRKRQPAVDSPTVGVARKKLRGAAAAGPPPAPPRAGTRSARAAEGERARRPRRR